MVALMCSNRSSNFSKTDASVAISRSGLNRRFWTIAVDPAIRCYSHQNEGIPFQAASIPRLPNGEHFFSKSQRTAGSLIRSACNLSLSLSSKLCTISVDDAIPSDRISTAELFHKPLSPFRTPCSVQSNKVSARKPRDVERFLPLSTSTPTIRFMINPTVRIDENAVDNSPLTASFRDNESRASGYSGRASSADTC